MAVSESDRDEERELRTLFRKTAGEDLEVDPYELRAILDSNFKHGSLEFLTFAVSFLDDFWNFLLLCSYFVFCVCFIWHYDSLVMFV